jgi:hypothetical protein
MTDKCQTFVARWDHAMCSTCGEEHDDLPAVDVQPPPVLDLDAAEKRAAGFRGRFRVMAYDSGDEMLEFVALDAYNCDESEIDDSAIDDVAQFSCDEETQRAIVATLNDAPVLIAEARAAVALRAEIVEQARKNREALRDLAAAQAEVERLLAATEDAP